MDPKHYDIKTIIKFLRKQYFLRKNLGKRILITALGTYKADHSREYVLNEVAKDRSRFLLPYHTEIKPLYCLTFSRR